MSESKIPSYSSAASGANAATTLSVTSSASSMSSDFDIELPMAPVNLVKDNKNKGNTTSTIEVPPAFIRVIKLLPRGKRFW